MNAVRGYPENRAAFERQRRADGQEIFHPLGSFVSAMRQQAVVSHANAQASRHPPQEHRHQECLPGKEEQRRDGADVKSRHESRCDPVDFVVGSGFHSSMQVRVP